MQNPPHKTNSNVGLLENVTPSSTPFATAGGFAQQLPHLTHPSHIQGVQRQNPVAPVLQSQMERINHSFPNWLYKRPEHPSSIAIFRDTEVDFTIDTPDGFVFDDICAFQVQDQEVAVLHLYGAKSFQFVASPYFEGNVWMETGDGAFSGKFKWEILFDGSPYKLQANSNGGDGELIGGYMVDRIYKVREGAPPLFFIGPGRISIRLTLLSLSTGGTVSPDGAKTVFSIAGYRFAIP